MQFRIGVNLGEVIVDRDEIYGDGVNVAARLENLAEPGGICISEAVRSAIGKKLPLDYEFMGERQVKNITEAVKAYSAKLRFGTVLSGIVIDIAGIRKNATAASLDPESLRVLGVALGPGILVLVGLTLLAASFYSITRAEHGRMLEVIARRKGAAETSGHQPAS